MTCTLTSLRQKSFAIWSALRITVMSRERLCGEQKKTFWANCLSAKSSGSRRVQKAELNGCETLPGEQLIVGLAWATPSVSNFTMARFGIMLSASWRN
jgi:hypothetical protein